MLYLPRRCSISNVQDVTVTKETVGISNIRKKSLFVASIRVHYIYLITIVVTPIQLFT